ncbi:hypothetical protein [Pseudomonas sp. NFR16]|uniref:hypothetical protein n=1 Tax=Pseudomonas sp. NFR16 TaxID=1566248 RepID=UPI0008C771AE|nr:hypothetical protein [Pseudomonas sp. NFR16]SEJ64471.1 hypothetical protein SAMN03159495_3938 [Pseudomonas sp. NFR16]
MANDKGESTGSWFWYAFAVFVLCTSSGGLLFGLYGHYFPAITGVRDDWNVFGALLGGFGSCIGAVATLATLLFLAQQNRQQQQFVAWQIETLTFEKFLSHRRVFSERLGEIQSRLEHKIRFRNPENLYYGLFPDNGPAKLLLAVAPDVSETSENLLGALKVRFEMLDQLIKKAEFSTQDAYELAGLLFEINSDLGFEWVGEPDDGDVVMAGLNIGVNIYSLHEALNRMKWIYNIYLRFTGNAPFDGLNHGVTRYVKDALMKCRRLRGYVVYRSVTDLQALQDLLFQVDSLRDDTKNWLLPDSYRLLEATFESRHDVAQLADSERYLSMLIKINNEIFDQRTEIEVDDPRYDELNACEATVMRIVGNVRMASERNHMK